MNRVLVDTGPLVALASARDEHHDRCTEQLRFLHPPLVTTWAVLTEVAWLLRPQPAACRRLFEAGAHGLFYLPELGDAALPWLTKFLRRYQKMKPRLAHGTLVYLAERENIDKVFTLDRRDFSVYRFGHKRSFQILPE